MAYRLKQAEWAKLTLRQDFADEEFMRGHISKAGLRVSNSTEPATVSRLRSLLRSVGVIGREIEEATGTTIAGYLALNPSLPLWAALGLILEATGRFTPSIDE